MKLLFSRLGLPALTFGFVTTLALVGCADSSAIVTGRTYPATVPESVRVFLTPPPKFEEIGLVTASSKNRGGFTRQARQDGAMRQLKAKAAELGANGVILKTQGTESSVGFVTGGVVIPSQEVAVTGVAVRVP